MQVVTIPFDFESLPSEDQQKVVPICIARHDDAGNDIAWGWFEACAEVQDPLRRIARFWLDDVWRVSELAQRSVHTLWHNHKQDLGMAPGNRILRQAKWDAQDLKAGTYRERKGLTVAFEDLADVLKAEALIDPTDYRARYDTQIELETLSHQLEQDGCKEVSTILKLLRDGCTWNEIGQRIRRDPNTTKKRYQRWIRVFRTA